MMDQTAQSLDEFKQHVIHKACQGAYKSFGTVRGLLEQNRRVVWLVRENVDVLVRTKQLKERMNVDALAIVSLEYQLDKRGMQPPKTKQHHLFDYSKIPSSKRLVKWYSKEFNVTDKAAKKAINKMSPKPFSFENHDVIVMTQGRMQSLKLAHQLSMKEHDIPLIPDDAVFVVDDVSLDEIKKYVAVSPKSERYADKKIMGRELERISGKQVNLDFYVKPDVLKFDYRLDNKFIWLTADNVKSKMIQAMYPNCRLVDMTTELGPEAGYVDVIAHNITTGNYQTLLLPICARVDKILRDKGTTLIGNSLKTTINCYNAEGSNDYIRTHNVIKISQPASNLIYEVQEQLQESNKNNIIKWLMLDQFEQMSGRNRGHRYINNSHLKSVRNSDCIVIVDRRYAKWISENTYFNIGSYRNLHDDPTGTAIPKDQTRLTLLYWLISNWERYISNELYDLGRRESRVIEDWRRALVNIRVESLAAANKEFVRTIQPLLNEVQKNATKDDPLANTLKTYQTLLALAQELQGEVKSEAA